MILQLWPAVVLVGLVGLLFNCLVRKQHNKRLALEWGCLEPTREINSDPILGTDRIRQVYAAFQARRYIAYYYQRFRANGSTFSTIVLLRRKIYTVDPENIRSILSKDSRSYSIGEDRAQGVRPLLGSSIFGALDKDWERARSLLLPGLPIHRAFNTDLFAQHSDELLSCLPPDGETVDLQDLFFRMTMDSATDLLFGKSVESLRYGRNKATQQFVIDSHDAQRGALRTTRLGRFAYIDPKERLRTKRATERCRSYIRDHLSAVGSDQKAMPQCLLRHLLESNVPEEGLIDHLLTMLIAAGDTTSSVLSTQFYFLARKPHIWRRLREEVAVLGGKRPSLAEVQQLKYVSWLVNETLRLYPSSPHNTRIAIRDTSLPTGGGPDGTSPIFVGKGQTVSYDYYTLHRSTSIYGSDAEDFRPERWENLNPGWGYLPFGGGPRMCPGKRFALVEAAYTTVRLAQHVERIEPRDDREWEELLTFSCVNLHGTKVALFRGIH